jgi:hypothetical protein
MFNPHGTLTFRNSRFFFILRADLFSNLRPYPENRDLMPYPARQPLCQESRKIPATEIMWLQGTPSAESGTAE